MYEERRINGTRFTHRYLSFEMVGYQSLLYLTYLRGGKSLAITVLTANKIRR